MIYILLPFLYQDTCIGTEPIIFIAKQCMNYQCEDALIVPSKQNFWCNTMSKKAFSLLPPQVNPGVGAFASSVPQSPHLYPHPSPLPPSPLQSPSSPPPPSQHKGTSGSEDPVSPLYLPPSSHNSADTGSGMVTTITNWLGARVKKIIGRLHDAANPSPRPPLHKPSVARPSPSTPNKVSPQQPNVSQSSISINDIDFSENSGASPESGSVYLRVPSPQNCAHDRQSHSLRLAVIHVDMTGSYCLAM